VTLALTGSSYDETEPIKATYEEAEAIVNSDHIEDNPAPTFLD
jgi:hypothetical protein